MTHVTCNSNVTIHSLSCRAKFAKFNYPWSLCASRTFIEHQDVAIGNQGARKVDSTTPPRFRNREEDSVSLRDYVAKLLRNASTLSERETEATEDRDFFFFFFDLLSQAPGLFSFLACLLIFCLYRRFLAHASSVSLNSEAFTVTLERILFLRGQVAKFPERPFLLFLLRSFIPGRPDLFLLRLSFYFLIMSHHLFLDQVFVRSIQFRGIPSGIPSVFCFSGNRLPAWLPRKGRETICLISMARMI